MSRKQVLDGLSKSFRVSYQAEELIDLQMEPQVKSWLNEQEAFRLVEIASQIRDQIETQICFRINSQMWDPIRNVVVSQVRIQVEFQSAKDKV